MEKIKIAVYDTYVGKKDGGLMHFDILVPEKIEDLELIYSFGRKYLKEKGEDGQQLTSKECKFCHIEEPDKKVLDDINLQGFSIIEMEGCRS